MYFNVRHKSKVNIFKINYKQSKTNIMKNLFLFLTLALFATIATAQEDYCNKLETSVDEFTGDVTVRTPLTLDGPNIVSFIKSTKKGIDTYYLSLYTSTGSRIYTGQGVILLLENDKKIEKPTQEVDYKLLSSTFYSRAFIRLNQDDIKLLKENGLKKFKLYISVGDITKDTEYYKKLFNCMTN